MLLHCVPYTKIFQLFRSTLYNLMFSSSNIIFNKCFLIITRKLERKFYIIFLYSEKKKHFVILKKTEKQSLIFSSTLKRCMCASYCFKVNNQR